MYENDSPKAVAPEPQPADDSMRDSLLSRLHDATELANHHRQELERNERIARAAAQAIVALNEYQPTPARDPDDYYPVQQDRVPGVSAR